VGGPLLAAAAAAAASSSSCSGWWKEEAVGGHIIDRLRLLLPAPLSSEVLLGSALCNTRAHGKRARAFGSGWVRGSRGEQGGAAP